MLKSEYAIDQVHRYLTGRGQVSLDSLIEQAWLFTDDGDPRWIGAALSRLDTDGKIRYPTCDDDHSHGSACTVELVEA